MLQPIKSIPVNSSCKKRVELPTLSSCELDCPKIEIKRNRNRKRNRKRASNRKRTRKRDSNRKPEIMNRKWESYRKREIMN